MVCRAGRLPVPCGADFGLQLKLMDIYHSYSAEDAAGTPSHFKNKQHRLSGILVKLSKILALSGALLVILSFLPSLWYSIKSNGGFKISELIMLTAKKSVKESTSVVPKELDYQPRYDPKLPNENRVKITSAGIDTPIREATIDNFETALKKGVWRVSDFGTPYSREKPIILAAHRYGYLAWSIPYRLRNSFYNLPKLKVGDTVEIIWRQRKYVYEVYAESEGDEITDFSASLILYTCEALNSPVRIFKYAKLIKG